MRLRILNYLFLLLATGCAHQGAHAEKEINRADVRLARAEVAALDGTFAKGTVNFEQMPNSVIVVFRIEGLEPRETYQLFILDSEDCETLDLRSASRLSKLRTNKEGIAEHTFKTTRFTVSRENALIDVSVAVAKRIPGSGSLSAFACGQIEPLNPENALEVSHL